MIYFTLLCIYIKFYIYTYIHIVLIISITVNVFTLSLYLAVTHILMIPRNILILV